MVNENEEELKKIKFEYDGQTYNLYTVMENFGKFIMSSEPSKLKRRDEEDEGQEIRRMAASAVTESRISKFNLTSPIVDSAISSCRTALKQRYQNLHGHFFESYCYLYISRFERGVQFSKNHDPNFDIETRDSYVQCKRTYGFSGTIFKSSFSAKVRSLLKGYENKRHYRYIWCSGGRVEESIGQTSAYVASLNQLGKKESGTYGALEKYPDNKLVINPTRPGAKLTFNIKLMNNISSEFVKIATRILNYLKKENYKMPKAFVKDVVEFRKVVKKDTDLTKRLSLDKEKKFSILLDNYLSANRYNVLSDKRNNFRSSVIKNYLSIAKDGREISMKDLLESLKKSLMNLFRNIGFKEKDINGKNLEELEVLMYKYFRPHFFKGINPQTKIECLNIVKNYKKQKKVQDMIKKNKKNIKEEKELFNY